MKKKIILFIILMILAVKTVYGIYQSLVARIVQNRTVIANYTFEAFCDGVPVGEGKVGIDFNYYGDCGSFEIREGR